MRFSFKIVWLVAVIAIVGSTLIGLTVFYSSRQLLIGRIEKGQLETAFSTMARVDQIMHKAYQDIQLISQDKLLEEFLVKEANFEEISALKARVHDGLKEMIFLSGPWDNLLIVDKDGTIIDSTQEKSIGEKIKKYPASNIAFQASLNKRPYYSDLILPDINTRPTVIFASPVTSEIDGRVMGVVIGHFSWPVIMQVLDRIEPTTHIHIFNKDGVDIATPTLERALILKQSYAGHELIKKALGGKRENSGVFTTVHPEQKKEKVLATVVLEEGFLNYKGNNWGLILETPLNIIFAPISKMLKNFIIYTGIGILLMIAVFYFMSRQFMRPLQTLTKVAKDIGSGNLDVKAEVKTKDEFGVLAKSFNEMVADLNRQAKELRDAQDKLVRSEKLATIGQLASSMAHEIRNPLGVMKNVVYYFNMLELGKENAEIKENLDILSGEIENVNKIISDLLEFSRVKEPTLRPDDINVIVNEVLHRLKIPSGIEVVTKLDDTLPEIEVDALQIQQVFSNISNNAIQVMEKDGSLTIITKLKDNFIEISFADTGSGIPKENLTKIFEPLFSTKTKGTGLGLSVVASLIEGHNGKIEVESETGKGTTFTVKLPIKRG